MVSSSILIFILVIVGCKIAGNVLLYDIHGKLLKTFLLLDVTTTSHIQECKFWGNGVVAMTADLQLFVAEGLGALDVPRKFTLNSGLLDPPRPPRTYTSMAIIPPLLARSGLLEVRHS